MTIYVTSDLHLGHKNILEYQPNRRVMFDRDLSMDVPVPGIERHDQLIIDRLRHNLTRHDTLYILGDFSLTSAAHRLDLLAELSHIGCQYNIIHGNHDGGLSSAIAKSHTITHYFHELPKLHDMSHRGMKVWMCHYPLETWPGCRENDPYPLSVMLHGHSHGHSTPRKGRLDVGWDVHNRIITLDEAIAMALEVTDGAGP